MDLKRFIIENKTFALGVQAKDWKAAVRTWEEKKKSNTSNNGQKVKLNATNPNRK